VIEVIVAAVIGAVLLWLVLQPLLAPSIDAGAETEILDPEETPRGQALLALKEIEFDHATGKLSEADFTALNAKYSAAAIAVLEPVAAATPVATGRRCLLHGARPEADALFCSDCGAGLLAGAACVACDTTIPVDASFCPGCGARVREAPDAARSVTPK
jgi:double zinc ribbon protein